MANKEKKGDNDKREQAKKISIIEGSSWSIMDGFGLRYITPYALALGASNFAVGLLSSLPSLLGNLAQLPVPRLMKNISRKKILTTTVFLQAFLWLPIILVGFLYFFLGINSGLAAALLIISYSLMIIAGSAPGPAWCSWMGDLLKEKQGEYFGKKNRITGFIGILSMVIAGIILNYFGKNNFIGFLIILTIAFLGRAFSGYLFTKQYEPEFRFEESYYFSPVEFIRKMSHNNFGRFVIFVSLFSFSTAIAGPFFAVYMLKDLNFSYIQFTIVTLSAPLVMMIFMPFWGKFADKFGNVRVMKITGILIPMIPVYWLGTLLILPFNSVSLIVVYLFICEILSGFAWSGFNLSSANFIYDAVSRQRMALCVSYFNLINAIGTFIGAMLGGLLSSNEALIFGIKPILFIIILSGLMRFAVYFISIPGIKEVRHVKNININHHIRSRIKYYIGLGFLGVKEIRD